MQVGLQSFLQRVFASNEAPLSHPKRHQETFRMIPKMSQTGPNLVLGAILGDLGDLLVSFRAPPVGGYRFNRGIYRVVRAQFCDFRRQKPPQRHPHRAEWHPKGQKLGPKGSHEGDFGAPRACREPFLIELIEKEGFGANLRFPAGKPLILRVRAGSPPPGRSIFAPWWCKIEPLEAKLIQK